MPRHIQPEDPNIQRYQALQQAMAAEKQLEGNQKLIDLINVTSQMEQLQEVLTLAQELRAATQGRMELKQQQQQAIRARLDQLYLNQERAAEELLALRRTTPEQAFEKIALLIGGAMKGEVPSDLLEMALALLQRQGEEGGSELLRGYLLGELARGRPSADRLETLLMQLRTLSEKTPPTPLSKEASKLLAELEGGDPKALLEDPEAQLEKLLQKFPKLLETLKNPQALQAELLERYGKFISQSEGQKMIERLFTPIYQDFFASMAQQLKELQRYLKEDPRLKRLEGKLKELEERFPGLSVEDNNRFHDLINAFDQLLKDGIEEGLLPDRARKTFEAMQEEMWRQMQAHFEEGMQDLKQQEEQLSRALPPYEVAEKSLALLSKPGAEGEEREAALQALEQVLPELDSEDRMEVQDFLDQSKQGPGAAAAAAPPAVRSTQNDFAKKVKAINTKRTVVRNVTYNGRSLPDAFAHALLKKFMPRQEEHMMNLAMLLFFQNFGAGMCNAFLGEMIGWSDSASHYGMNDWINSRRREGQNNLWSGDWNQANARIADERARANRDIEAIDRLRGPNGVLARKLAEAKEELRPENYAKIEREINALERQLGRARQSLVALNDSLARIRFEDAGGGNFRLVDANMLPELNDLKRKESNVINGDPNFAPDQRGGLLTISSKLTTDQQNYSSLGQQQQIKLQMEMTTTQQEWSLIATMLQMLNQIYISLSQAIFR